MISVREALAHSLATVPEVTAETVPIDQSYNRVLAEDVQASSPLPPWDNSAMDGFALHAEDTQAAEPIGSNQDECAENNSVGAQGPWLTVIETIAAGQSPSQSVRRGESARIMTGAPMPDGANAVVMREQTHEERLRVQILAAARPHQNIRFKGEDVHEGDIVLTKGHTLTPASVGLASAVGRSHLTVARRPRVGIIATGDELRRPGEPLGPGLIYSSNTSALIGMTLEAGAIPVDCGIAPDNLVGTREAFEKASGCDLIISTGGVSVGDFDVVKEAMSELGAEMKFWKVRMKPGKPLALGVIGNTPAFGLPGNPVSCQVSFVQFVRPWLRRSLGDPRPFAPVMDAVLTDSYAKKAGRVEFVRVKMAIQHGTWYATPTGSQGSGSQTSMAAADGLMLLDEQALRLESGQAVQVQMLGPFPGQAHEGYPWD